MNSKLVISGVLAAALAVTAVAVSAKEGGHRGHHGPKMNFEQIDANGDGQITREEMEALAKTRFDAADANGDGFLSADEMKASAMKQAEQRAEKRAARMIEHRDADNDGKLSFDEMQPKGDRADKMFGRADANNDGAISKEEFDEARAKMKEHRKGGKHKPSAEN